MLQAGDVFHDGAGYCLVYSHWHKGKNKYILRYIRLYTIEFKDTVLLDSDKNKEPLTNLKNLNGSLDSVLHYK